MKLWQYGAWSILWEQQEVIVTNVKGKRLNYHIDRPVIRDGTVFYDDADRIPDHIKRKVESVFHNMIVRDDVYYLKVDKRIVEDLLLEHDTIIGFMIKHPFDPKTSNKIQHFAISNIEEFNIIFNQYKTKKSHKIRIFWEVQRIASK